MKDPKTENFLNSGGYKWRYVQNIDFAEIDIEELKNNPARLYKKVDQDRAINYAIAMERGDEFPAIMVLTLDPDVSRFLYLIATGVHRHAAYDTLGRTSCDAYVVMEGDKYRRESLIRRANIIEGYGVSHDDRIAQALQMHETYPEIPMVQLAQDWGVKADTFKTAVIEQKAIERGSRFGHNFTGGRIKLPQRSILALNTIHSDVVFDRAASFALETGATTAEIIDLCKDAKKARDDKSGLDIVTQAAEAVVRRRNMQRVQHTRPPRAASSKFFHGMRGLNSLAGQGIEKLYLSGHPDRSGFRMMCDETIATIKRVIDAIDHLDRVEGNTKPNRQPQGQALH